MHRHRGGKDLRAHVFISHASHDAQLAQEICSALEARGIRCWIAPRDVPPGALYGEALVDAIRASRALVLLLSHHANDSGQVARELERAASGNVPIIPLRVVDVQPSKALEFFISSHHWIDLFRGQLDTHADHIAAALPARPTAPPTATDLDTAHVPPYAAPARPSPVLRPAPSRASPPPDTTPFLGRQEEYNRLAELYARLNVSQGCLVFIEGQLGIGKTRLITEFFQSAHGQATVLEGRYTSLEFDEGYAAPLKGIRQQLLSLFGVKIGDPSLQVAERVEACFAKWAYGGRDESSFFTRFLSNTGYAGNSNDSASLNKIQYFHALSSLLFHLSQRCPLIMFLDDLQWADPITFEYIDHVANCLKDESAPILLIAAYRTDGSAFNPHLKRILALLSRYSNDIFFHSELEALARPAIEKLAETMIGPCDKSVIDYLFEKGEGNPFYTIELVRFLKSQGRLIQADGAAAFRSTNAHQLPFSLKQIIEARLARIAETSNGPRACEILDWMSVFGNECLVEVLKSALDMAVVPGSKTLAETCDEDLDELARRDVLHLKYDQTSNRTLCAFSSKMMRDTIYENLSQQKRLQMARYHEAVGRALASCGARTAEIAPVLSYHFMKAQKKREAFDYLLVAAQQALGAFSYDEASSYAEKLTGLAKDPDLREHLTPERKSCLLLTLGDIDERAGHYERSLTHYHACLHECAACLTGEARLQLLDRIGQVYTRVGRWNEALECFEDVDRQAASIRNVEFLIAHKTSLASAHYVHTGRVREAIDALERTRIGQPGNQSRQMGRLLAHLAIFSSETSRWDDALRYAREALQYFEALRAFHDVGMIKATMANIHLEREEHNLAASLYSDSEAVFRRYPYEFGATTLALNKAILALATDDLKEAEILLGQAQDGFRRLGNQHALSQCIIVRGNLLFLRGLLSEAQSAFLEARALQHHHHIVDLREQATVGNNLGCVYALNGASDPEPYFQRALDAFRRLEDLKRLFLCTLNSCLHLYRKGDHDQASSRLAEARRIAPPIPLRDRLPPLDTSQYRVLARPKPNA